VNSIHLLPPIPLLQNSLPREAHLHNQSQVVEPKMAPTLAPKHELLYDMIFSGEYLYRRIAEAAGCNRSTIRRISSNVQMFRSVNALHNKGGRPRNITPVMLEVLWEQGRIWGLAPVAHLCVSHWVVSFFKSAALAPGYTNPARVNLPPPPTLNSYSEPSLIHTAAALLNLNRS
jgi:hypothetical protein